MAPILSFTAEEAWGILCNSSLAHQPDTKRLTIFTECYHSLPTITEADTLQQRWSRLREIRALVTRKLEELRTAGSIGSSLQGEVDLTAQGADLALLQSVAEQLPFILIVSKVSVHEATAAGQTELLINIAPSAHKKCERCWHWRHDIGHNAEHPDICGRCVSNLHEAHANG
jgi:isoleucyl-tRNA synthetase